MAEDFDSDCVPVKDCVQSPSRFRHRCVTEGSVVAERNVVVKLPRKDLEDRYLKLNEENLFLKKSINEQEKELRRLQIQFNKLEPSRTGNHSPVNQYYESRVKKLEQIKKCLEGKVEVLKQQLQTHSKLHAKVHRHIINSPSSFSNRIQSQGHPSSSPFPMVADYEQRLIVSDREDNMRKSQKDFPFVEQSFVDQVEAIELEHFSDNEPLEECQKTVDSEGDRNKVVENIELIRFKRLIKRQSAQLTAMTAHSEAAEKEMQLLRKDYEKLISDYENISKVLNFERQKIQTMLKETTQISSLKQDIRMLEEQVRDLKQERLQLKDHNDKLLRLAANSGEGIQREAAADNVDNVSIMQESSPETIVKDIDEKPEEQNL
ncbi:uncharacterized protein LOC142322162 [Lycorma delicatula]|uniref:uncharacterized protein LOC142322162 n=1 Tax=Lycorma delicatula TaxID=130591 RepID=UPI003F51708A